jgi:hypothetical protein
MSVQPPAEKRQPRFIHETTCSFYTQIVRKSTGKSVFLKKFLGEELFGDIIASVTLAGTETYV